MQGAESSLELEEMEERRREGELLPGGEAGRLELFFLKDFIKKDATAGLPGRGTPSPESLGPKLQFRLKRTLLVSKEI